MAASATTVSGSTCRRSLPQPNERRQRVAANDWRPPKQQDSQRPQALLNEVAIRLRGNAEAFEQAEKDLRLIGGEDW